MRTLTAGQTTLLQSGDYDVHVIVEVEDSAGVYQDVTSEVVAVEWEVTTDELVNAATVEFRRGDGSGSSYAPLMTANPPVDVMRGLRFKVATVAVGATPISGDYEQVFAGAIDRVLWPQRFPGRVKAECRDSGGALMDAFIQEERQYGSADGVALETVMQQVLDDNGFEDITLYVPTATGAVVTPAYNQQKEPVLQALRTLAESIGWTVRYRYIDSLSAWRLTLYEPERDKTVADFTFGTSQYYDVSQMEIGVEDTRNKVKVESPNDDGTRSASGTPISDSASITKYSPPGFTVERYMEIVEADDSPIVGETKRVALATAALNDLSEPDAVLEIVAPLWWPGEVGVDLYSFTANSIHFSSNQALAPTSFRHRIAVGERPETRIQVRGKPSGGQLMWRRREQTSEQRRTQAAALEAQLALSGVVLTIDQDVGTYTLTWLRPELVERVMVWERQLPANSSADPHAVTTLDPVANLEAGTDSYSGTLPTPGFFHGVTLIPYHASGKQGPAWKGKVWPIAGVGPTVEWFQTPGAGTVDLRLYITDPQLMSGTVYVWTNHDAYTSPDPSAAFEGSYSYAGASLVEIAPTTVFNLPPGSTSQLLNNIVRGQKQGKTVYVEAVATDGRTSGQVAIELENILDLVDDLGVIEREQITAAWQFADLFKMPRLYADAASLPADNTDSDYAVALDTGRGYQWDDASEAWVTYDITSNANVGFFPALLAGIVKTVHLEALSVTTTILAANAVSTSKLQADAVTAAKLASITMEVGKYIESSNYVAGSTGWRLDANGDLEASSGTFRGSLSSVDGSMVELDMNGAITMHFGEGIQFNHGVLDSPGPLLRTASASQLTIGTNNFSANLFIGDLQGTADNADEWGGLARAGTATITDDGGTPRTVPYV